VEWQPRPRVKGSCALDGKIYLLSDIDLGETASQPPGFRRTELYGVAGEDVSPEFIPLISRYRKVTVYFHDCSHHYAFCLLPELLLSLLHVTLLWRAEVLSLVT
jgi:hypothetical protein